MLKGERREKARHKAQHGMRVSGRSVKTLAEVVQKKAQLAKPTIAVCPNCEQPDAFAYCDNCGWHPKVRGCRCPDCR